MAVALGLEEDFFSSKHRYMFEGSDKNRTIFRTLFYPSLADSEVEPGVVRCGQHHDYGSIILLMQDEMGGLEVNKRHHSIGLNGSLMVSISERIDLFSGQVGACHSDCRVDPGQLGRFDAILDFGSIRIHCKLCVFIQSCSSLQSICANLFLSSNFEIHRVVVPEEEVRRRSPRQSIAFFVHPDTGTIISPLDGDVDKHPPVEALAYIQSRVSATYK